MYPSHSSFEPVGSAGQAEQAEQAELIGVPDDLAVAGLVPGFEELAIQATESADEMSVESEDSFDDTVVAGLPVPNLRLIDEMEDAPILPISDRIARVYQSYQAEFLRLTAEIEAQSQARDSFYRNFPKKLEQAIRLLTTGHPEQALELAISCVLTIHNMNKRFITDLQTAESAAFRLRRAMDRSSRAPELEPNQGFRREVYNIIRELDILAERCRDRRIYLDRNTPVLSLKAQARSLFINAGGNWNRLEAAVAFCGAENVNKQGLQCPRGRQLLLGLLASNDREVWDAKVQAFKQFNPARVGMSAPVPTTAAAVMDAPVSDDDFLMGLGRP